MMTKGLEAYKLFLDDVEQCVQSGGIHYINRENRDIIVKELEALDVIRNKKVNLEYLKCCENYEQYKTICSYWNEITEKEFDLLKEVLV